MKILYYDCFSGISGDMNLGAMIDLGVDPGYLKGELEKLDLSGWELKIEKDQRHGIFGTKVTVIQTIHEHKHRHLSDIEDIIKTGSYNDRVTELSLKLFKVIAGAEAKVHNSSIEKVHFHEVGAIDSIIDIVGAAICLDKISVDMVISSRVELGGGFVECAHGTLPVPAPATSEIIKGIEVSTGGVDFEATTPTGAAIIKVFSSHSGRAEGMTILKTGYGIGQKINDKRPNILRVFIGEVSDEITISSKAMLIESNIDDMSPEWYESLHDKLMRAGASDVFLTQVIMKKGRPGTKVTVLVENSLLEPVKDVLFIHSGTLGARIIPVDKISLERNFKKTETPFGKITIKYGYYKGKKVSAKPEFAECLKIAEKENISIKEVYNSIPAEDLKTDYNHKNEA